ncbi:MAG: glycosyltransferase family 39 protein [Chloroflexota bacterium]|nr:glycosyltransferase family 39 protein [Chloroflexota bacterium]
MLARYRQGIDAGWLLPLILLVALGLRLWGLDFGLPYLYHPDEPLLMEVSQHIVQTGDLNPHYFGYPSLFFYINALVMLPFYLGGMLLGLLRSSAGVAYPVWYTLGVGYTDAQWSFLLVRLVTVLFGLGTVALAYKVAADLVGSRLAGWLAALFTAVSSANIINSRYVTPNVQMTFFLLLAFWYSLRILKEGATRHYLLAGIAVGLVASSKYNGAVIVLVLLAAHLFRHGMRGLLDRRIYFSFLAAGSTFLLTSPFSIFDSTTFLDQMSHEAQHYSSGHLGMDGNTLSWYLGYLWSVEGPVTLLAVLEIFRALVIRSRPLLLLSIFPVIYFIFISTFAVRNDRTVLPLIPLLFILGASFLVSTVRFAATLSVPGRRLLTYGVAAVTLVALLVPSVQSVSNTSANISGVRSREQARMWIEGNVPPGSQIAVETYGPYIDPQKYSVDIVSLMVDHTADWYKSHGYSYLVFSSGMYGRFYGEPERYAADVANYEKLFGSFQLVERIPDARYEMRVYKVDR